MNATFGNAVELIVSSWLVSLLPRLAQQCMASASASPETYICAMETGQHHSAKEGGDPHRAE